MDAPTSQSILVQEPAYCRLKTIPNFDEVEDEEQIGKDDLSELLNLKPLHQILLKENNLIQTLVRMRTNQLRKDKSIQLIKRVKSCLQRIEWMKRLFTLGADLLADIRMFHTDEDSHYLPCSQSWKYLLYLIWQYHQLLQRTKSYCVTAFQYLTCALTTGHLLGILVLFMGTSARIWQVSTVLSHKFAELYNRLCPFQYVLKAAKSDWICPNLPSELVMMNDNTDPEDRIVRKLKEHLSEAEVRQNENPILAPVLSGDSLSLSGPQQFDEEDLGVPLSIEEFKSKREIQKKRKVEILKEESTSMQKRIKVDNGNVNTMKKAKILNIKNNDIGDARHLNNAVKKKKKKKKSLKSTEDSINDDEESIKIKRKKKKGMEFDMPTTLGETIKTHQKAFNDPEKASKIRPSIEKSLCNSKQSLKKTHKAFKKHAKKNKFLS